jgi:hypothetical protein
LEFRLYFDTEPNSDFLYLESTVDAGRTWQPVPFAATGSGFAENTNGSVQGYEGRQWLRASAELADPVQLLWRYTTDPLYHGRGVYVDGVRVSAGKRVAFDDRNPRQAALFQAAGWVRSRD